MITTKDAIALNYAYLPETFFKLYFGPLWLWGDFKDNLWIIIQKAFAPTSKATHMFLGRLAHDFISIVYLAMTFNGRVGTLCTAGIRRRKGRRVGNLRINSCVY